MKCIFARPNEIEFRSSHIGDLAQLQSQSPSLSTAHRRVGTCRVDSKPKSCCRSRCLCRCELALCELFGAQRVGAVVVVLVRVLVVVVFAVAVAKTLNTGYVAAAVGAASIAGSASAWCWSCALSLESVRVKQSSAYPANAVLF